MVLVMGVWMEVVVPEMMMGCRVYLPSWTDSSNLKRLLMLAVIACMLHWLMSGSLAVASPKGTEVRSRAARDFVGLEFIVLQLQLAKCWW